MTLSAAFAHQGDACVNLGSPFMGRLMQLFAARLRADHSPVAARLFTWEGDVSAAGHSLPLRLAGGLHALRLLERADLATVYPPHEPTEDALWACISEAIRSEDAFLQDWLDRPPQTNELRRASVLKGIGHWLADRFGLPLHILELGASAGLNLNWDRFAMSAGGMTFGPTDSPVHLAPDWRGNLPPQAKPNVQARAGVDLTPLSPEADQLRLMAYLWPDQPDRLDRMRAALTLPQTPVDAGDAADWITAKLALPPSPGTCRLIYHTVAWQYFPQMVQSSARGAIEAAGLAAGDTTPLAWFGMEADGSTPGAGLRLHLWPGDHVLDVGRCDFHGRWVDWRL